MSQRSGLCGVVWGCFLFSLKVFNEAFEMG